MKKIFVCLFVLSLIFGASPALADSTDSFLFLQGVAEEGGAGYTDVTGGEDLYPVVGRIINIALSLLGAFFLILMIYGGFKWMTAGGNDTDIKKAQAIIYRAVIGLVIILLALSISRFVLGGLIRATT